MGLEALIDGGQILLAKGGGAMKLSQHCPSRSSWRIPRCVAQ
ncbi:hypothetical protein WL1483_473 [Aeromonas schubertii]|uniref:Uncharacterized protein n=1 Tax=Aeromonas schubertii TaxID=652 RepID=A0A0S2SDY4_9GAMM|nr:hypothetical protein WL1483_473 [Aeromonas schubertii]